jgi:hypothetical protein
MSKKTILKEETIQSINYDTGELIEESSIKTFKVDKEPDFIKLYTDDILRLKDVPKGMNGVILSLLKRMNYQNEVYIISHVKKQIAEELDIKEVTIRKALDTFVKKEILIRKDRAVYMFNPKLFGRGSWEDIRKLRLTITYERGKGRDFETEFIN